MASHPSAAAVPPPPAVADVGPPALPSTLRGFLLYFLRLGTFGFGGPIALAGHMQKDLVDERRWISRQDYIEGLALAQLMPGPSAAAALVPVWLFTGPAGPQPELLWRILGYFAAAGAFVFGSGLAIVPFLHGGVLLRRGGAARGHRARSPCSRSGANRLRRRRRS